ncbi:MAG: MBOAT family protein [Bacteroidetes bacterium]|nr:MBOAT family protein [Bacteroidota bacterium]
MLFNSLPFAIFLPLVFIIYWALAKRSINIQNVFLLIASYTFYAWWDIRFLILIIISSLTDYIVGYYIHASSEQSKRKLLLWTSILLNLGLLAFFKYFNFFQDSFIDMFNSVGIAVSPFTLKVILPVGISFYTFQTLSYTIDIYRRKIEPTKNAIAFFTFVAFFPQLVAGPIERAANLIPQFLKRRTFDYHQAVGGLRLIVWGLFKKAVIADRLAVYVDMTFGDPGSWYGINLILASLFFVVQIYCDFSGYSDMAIGIARLLGFNLMTNFRTPFFSTSFKEFWNRWHISLSTWFRDYIYISLGGNRVNLFRWTVIILITFAVSGLWHGSEWTFIVFGLFHGVLVAGERFLNTGLKWVHKTPRILKMAMVFMIFCFTMILFRSESFSNSLLFISHIPMNLNLQFSDITSLGASLHELFSSKFDLLITIASLLIFLIFEIWIGKEDFNIRLSKFSAPLRWLIYYMVVGWIIIFGIFDNARNFIYFQF